MSILGKQNSSWSSCWILFPFIINVSVTCEDITEGKIWFVRGSSCLLFFFHLFLYFFFLYFFILFIFSVVLFSSSSSFCFFCFSFFLFFFLFFLFSFILIVYFLCFFHSFLLVLLSCGVCVQSSPQRYMSRGRLILAQCKLLLDPKRLHWLRTRCLQGEKISAGPITFPKTCLHLWTQKVREGASVCVEGERGEWLEGGSVAVVDVAAGSPAFTIRFSPKCDRRNMWFVFPPTDEPIDFFSDPEIFKLKKTLEAKWIWNKQHRHLHPEVNNTQYSDYFTENYLVT